MEIVRTNNTSPQVIVDLMDFGKKMRKIPIVIGDLEGHSINSLHIKYLHAAIFLAERGVDVYLIDQAFTSFGMLLGPFRYAGNSKSNLRLCKNINCLCLRSQLVKQHHLQNI